MPQEWMPVRVLNATAASFLVSASVSGGALYVQLPDRLGQLTRASSLSVTLSTNAVVLALTPGVQRVQSATAASFLLTAKAVSLTNASFLAQVSVPAFVNVKGPTTRGSTVVDAGHSLVISASQASFLVSNPGVQRVSNAVTAASFLAQVNVPGFVNVKGPTTRGSTVVQADHSLVIATNASFGVNVPGVVKITGPTTRGSTIAQVDHSAIISVSAASFTVGNKGISYSSVWPAAQSTGVYNPMTVDTLGRPVVLLNTTPGRSESTVVALTSPNTAQAIFNAISGVRHVVTDLSAWNQSGTAVTLQFCSGVTGPVANPTGKRLWFCRSQSSALSGMIDQDFVTPVFTNIGATFACWGNVGLSSTTRLKIFASGYQSTV